MQIQFIFKLVVVVADRADIIFETIENVPNSIKRFAQKIIIVGVETSSLLQALFIEKE